MRGVECDRLLSMAEISFPLAPKDAPEPPESGFAEVATPPAQAVVTGRIVEDTIPAPAPQAPVSGLAEVVTPEEPEARAQVIREQTMTTPITTAPDASAVSTYKRARRFHADTPFILGLLLLLITAMAGASFYVSFSGLYSAAAWAVGDNPPLQFAVPIMLDISIIAFTLALFIERERGDKVWGTWVAISAFTVVSATANIFHTFAVSTAVDVYELSIGAVISGGAPLLLAFATDKIAVKVFQEAESITPVGKK